jgi:outer membrane lipoprotein-sorting protein
MDTDLGSARGLTVLVLVGAVALVAVAGAATMGDSPDGETLLNDSYERYAAADSVVGDATVTVANDSASANATVSYAAKGNMSRVVVTRANETYRAGSNGTVAWYVAGNRSGAWELDALRQRARTEYNDSEVPTPEELLERTRERYGNASVEVVRTGSDDGTEAHVVRVTAENESIDGDTTLWIATDDDRLLRAEVTDGTNRTVVDFEDTQFNASVHDSTFDPPADRVSVTRLTRYDSFAAAQSNTSLALPQLDATFVEAGVLGGPEGTDVAQRYRADGDNVTVVTTTVDRSFERAGENVTNVTVDGHPATVTSARNATVVYWETDGVTTAVVVEDDQERALELARRLAA